MPGTRHGGRRVRMVHQQPVVQMDSRTWVAFRLVKIIALGQGKGLIFPRIEPVLKYSREATSLHGSFSLLEMQFWFLEMVVPWGSGQLQDEHTSLGNTFFKWSKSGCRKTELIAERAILLEAAQQFFFEGGYISIGNLLLLFIICISCKSKENWAGSAVPVTGKKNKTNSFSPKDVTKGIKDAWEYKGSWRCFSLWYPS